MASRNVSDPVSNLQRRATDVELKFLVIGRAGQGKSTLINNLLGFSTDDPRAAIPRGEVFRGTSYVRVHSTVRDDATVRVLDTPGLFYQSHVDHEKILKQLSELSDEKLDLVLVCFSCEDGNTWDDHTKVIQLLTKKYGKNFWKRAVFVMTFVNTLKKDRYTHSTWLSKVEKKFKDTLSEALQSVQCSQEEANEIGGSVPCLTAGNEPGNLPYEEEDWNKRLFVHCLKRINPHGIPTLFQARYGAQVWSKVRGAGTVGATVGGATGIGIGAGIGAAIGVLGGRFTGSLGAVVGAGIVAIAGVLIGGGVGIAVGAIMLSDEEIKIIRRELHRQM